MFFLTQNCKFMKITDCSDLIWIADLDPPQWELRHMRPPNQWPSWTRSSMRVLQPGHLWTAISCLSFLLWHPALPPSLHAPFLFSTPPLPSIPSHPPLTEDDVTFCQTARDHATVTVGCSVYTEIESNKSHEREREKKEGETGEKIRKKSGRVTEEKMCCRASGLDVVCQAGNWSPSLLAGMLLVHTYT